MEILLIDSVVAQRHVTDAVTAVNFDYRGVDTLGEESILFVSITGTLALLRRHRDETEHPPIDMAQTRNVPATSDAVRVFGLYFIGLSALFGIYIVTHGQLSPGGGFQGGVIVASALLLVYSGSCLSKIRVRPRIEVKPDESILR